MTEHSNDKGNWIVAVLTNGWIKVAYTEQAENVARQKAEALAIDPMAAKCDLEAFDLNLVEAVYVYERKASVVAQKVAKWL